jgi:hypothetical protein
MKTTKTLLATVGVSATVLLPLMPVAATQSQPSQVRDVKCLLEIKGVRYVRDICKFVKIDNQGSFSLSETRGLGLIAQINITQKDQGQASWNGPSGKDARTSLGTVYRTESCWSGGDNNVLICAWSMDQDVYLGPTPPDPDPSTTIYYGSRVGMFHDIASKKGIDTSNAQLNTTPSRAGAIIFCRNYEMNYSSKCINDIINNDGPKTATANCRMKTFTDFRGSRFQFLGKNSDMSGDIFAEYLIKDLKSGEVLDGSSASGYDIVFNIFKTLCPIVAGQSN